MPNIRFKLFENNWIETTLHDISLINPSTPVLPENFIYIDLDSVNDGVLTKVKKININEAPSRAQRYLHKGDILFQTVRPYQMNNYYFNLDDTKYVASTGYAQIRSKIYPKFLYYYLHNPRFIKEVLRRCTGTSYPSINSADLKKIKIKIPSSEKEKMMIGNLFANIDQKRISMEKKYEKVIQFKKSILEKIFKKELNFKNNEWITIKLKDIGQFYRGHSYNSSNVTQRGLLVLRSNNIKNNKISLSEQLQFVNKDCKEELKLKKGDIVICMSNGSRNLVGKTGQYMGNYDGNLTVGAFCSIFRPKLGLSKFLFQTESYKKQLYLILAGTNINNLKNSDLENFSFEIPIGSDEIDNICSFLDYIDSNIYSLEKKIEKIKEFKKYLLQQMFV